jgi:drug/metabolite transporter (DMT)-like permease
MQEIIGSQGARGQARTSLREATAGHGLGGTLRVLTAAGLMGTLGPIAAVAYREGLAPPTLSALRAGFGAAILAVLVWSGRQPSIRLARLARRQQVLLAVAVVVNGVMNLALFLAFGAMAVGLVMLLFYCNPVLVAVISAVLGRDALTPMRVLALGVAGAGLALILGSQLGPEAHATAAGVLLAGCAAVCHAIYLVVIRGGFDDVPTVQATSLVLAGGVVISGAAAVASAGTGAVGTWLGSPAAWLAIAAVATVGALPKVWVIGGVRLIGSTRAAICMLVEPAVAVVVASVALGQMLTGLELVGGACILTAVALVQLPAGSPAVRVSVEAS